MRLFSVYTTARKNREKCYSVIVSKSVVNLAVARNRAKRRVRALLSEMQIPKNKRYVITIKTDIQTLSPVELKQEIKKQIK